MKYSKSNKLMKNILFSSLVIFIIFGICLFNYKMDPYMLFENKYCMRLSNYPLEMIYTVMKSYNDYKSDTVVIGGSETISLFDEQYKNCFNNVSIEAINYKQYGELLDAYLKIHPETKRVIIVLNLIKIINNIDISIPEFNDKNLTLKEYQHILFSTDVTIKSFKLLKNKILSSIINFFDKKEENILFEFYPKQTYKFKLSTEELKKSEKKNLNEINSLIKMLNEKNLDYVFIIPPYHAIFLSLIYNREFFQNNVDNFKRFLVLSVPSDKKIYDFAFINKYTSSDLFINEHGLYYNSSHPTFIYGAKIHKVIYNNKIADDSIYFSLNKNNIEFIIDKENDLLKNYINNNYKLIQYYTKITENQTKENLLFAKRINFESLSEDSKNEIEYLDKNIKKF